VSRWLITAGPCSPEVFPDATTRTTVVTALSLSTDSNPRVRDISLTGVGCTEAGSMGMKVTVAGSCFEHVHPHLYDVRDATYWTLIHDGNEAAFKANRANPIARWAERDGLVYLEYPSHHQMNRWSDKEKLLPKAGRYMDTVLFSGLDSELQTIEIANLVGATSDVSADAGFESCGSPGEVVNVPDYGHMYHFFDPQKDTVHKVKPIFFFFFNLPFISPTQISFSKID
jgi:hypothetical protein